MVIFKKKELTISRYQRQGLWYVLPFVIGFLVFNIIPIASSLYYSFTNLQLMNNPKWTGLRNFIYMFTLDDTFYQSLKVTLIYTFVSVPVKIAFALLIALILTAEIKGLSVYRLLFYLPSILGGSVVISIMWKFLFMQDGYINNILINLGLPAVKWLGPKMSLTTISILQVWQFGSSMVLFLAALKNVPTEYYEAANIDGAGRTRRFIKITIPIISPIILFNLLMQLIQSFQHLTAPMVITGGGPLHTTYLFGMKIWEEAFTNTKLGYSSALSWVLVVIIIGITLVIFKTSKVWVYDEANG